MNAVTLYDRGFSGRGITAGVVDSGIDIASEEFAGRISPASRSTAGNPSIDDEDGHGTAVAFTLAGRRNGAGSHGAAPEATLIVLRTDTPGSCASDDPGVDESGCRHSITAIGNAIDVARENGARVINVSLGGTPGGQGFVDAISRATAAGIIVVMSAGNEFEDDPAGAANPNGLAQVANNTAASRGLVIVAGSVDSRDTLSSFSNRAGNTESHFLSAVGEDVRAPCDDTQVCLWSGTSFSAPQISGAIALLAQAFPNLSGAQIVQILYASARDGGAPGTDTIYGRGILDLARAFQPIGTTSIAGSGAVVSSTSNANLSAPMGDAAVGGLGAVILDGFDRAYALDLARTIQREGPARRLAGALQEGAARMVTSLGGTAVAVTIAQDRRGTAIDRMMLSTSDATRARALAATVTGAIGARAAFAIGASEGSAALSARLTGRSDAAFLVARDPTTSAGFDLDTHAAVAIRRLIGTTGITVAIESGDVLNRDRSNAIPALTRRWDRFGYDRLMIGIDRRFGMIDTAMTFSRLAERDTLLGAHFSGALGNAGAASWLVDAAWRIDAGDGWRIGGTLRQGWTRARLTGDIGGSGRLRTNGWSLDATKDGLFGNDTLGLRIAQPMRVASGGIDLVLPVDYDYASTSVSSWATQRLNLTPVGREIDSELRYARPFWRGQMATHLFWRRDPGNFAAIPDDIGGAVRFVMAF